MSEERKMESNQKKKKKKNEENVDSFLFPEKITHASYMIDGKLLDE